jgi:hypothetical protein
MVSLLAFIIIVVIVLAVLEEIRQARENEVQGFSLSTVTSPSVALTDHETPFQL